MSSTLSGPGPSEAGTFKVARTNDGLALETYWNGLRDGTDLPAYAQIDPVRIPRAILPGIFVLEFDGEGLRYRFSGTRLRAVGGIELKGLYADGQSSAKRDIFAALMHEQQIRPFGTWSVRALIYEGCPTLYCHVTTFPVRDGTNAWPYLTLGLIECDMPGGYRGASLTKNASVSWKALDVGFGVPDETLFGADAA
jgi:hypothetical protein